MVELWVSRARNRTNPGSDFRQHPGCFASHAEALAEAMTSGEGEYQVSDGDGDLITLRVGPLGELLAVEVGARFAEPTSSDEAMRRFRLLVKAVCMH